MRVLISVVASLMLMLILVGPVAATGPGCSEYGAATTVYAKAGGFGQLVSFVAHGGLSGAGFDGVSQLVQWEHSTMCSHP